LEIFDFLSDTEKRRRRKREEETHKREKQRGRGDGYCTLPHALKDEREREREVCWQCVVD